MLRAINPEWRIFGIVELVQLGFDALLLWQSLIPGLDSLRYEDETQDLALPIFLYWLPIFIGLTGTLIGAIWSVFRPTPQHDGDGSDILENPGI